MPSPRTLRLVLALLVANAPATFAETPAASFALPPLNRTFVDVVPELDPIRSGPLVVTPQVPRSALEIQSHRVDLTPAGPGLYDVLLEVTIRGRGFLDAELALAGAATSLRDEVTLPPQTLRIPGRIQLRWSAGGLAVTTVALPSALDVRIESAVAGRLVGTCQAMVALLPLGCDGLDGLLSRLRVPLADPGATYLVPASMIDDSARRALAGLLGPNGETVPE